MTTYPNQQVITVHKTVGVNNFMQINNDSWQKAARELTPSAFKLYLYLCNNKDGYTLALSPKAVKDAVGVSADAYRKAKAELDRHGYLVFADGNNYHFFADGCQSDTPLKVRGLYPYSKGDTPLKVRGEIYNNTYNTYSEKTSTYGDSQSPHPKGDRLATIDYQKMMEEDIETDWWKRAVENSKTTSLIWYFDRNHKGSVYTGKNDSACTHSRDLDESEIFDSETISLDGYDTPLCAGVSTPSTKMVNIDVECDWFDGMEQPVVKGADLAEYESLDDMEQLIVDGADLMGEDFDTMDDSKINDYMFKARLQKLRLKDKAEEERRKAVLKSLPPSVTGWRRTAALEGFSTIDDFLKMYPESCNNQDVLQDYQMWLYDNVPAYANEAESELPF